MSENENTTREITLSDIFKAIRKKLKAVVAVALIALIIGAAAGAAMTLISNATYGAKAEFNITSSEANTHILALLRSDSFAETLLLDENGLPAEKAGTPEYAEVQKLQGELVVLKKELKDAGISLERYPTMLTNAKRASDDAKAQQDSLKELLQSSLEGGTEASVINEYKELLAEAKTDYAQAKAEYESVLKASQDLEQRIDEIEYEIVEKKSEIEEKRVVLLVDFRRNKEIVEKIDLIKKSISYNYVEETNKSEDKNNSRSLLNVTVAVQFDKAFAEELVNKISLRLPAYVEDSIAPTEEEAAPTCTFKSGAGIVDSVNYKNPVIESVKYGVIALIVGAVVAMGVVVLALFVNSSYENKAETQEVTEKESKEE